MSSLDAESGKLFIAILELKVIKPENEMEPPDYNVTNVSIDVSQVPPKDQTRLHEETSKGVYQGYEKQLKRLLN